jgi:hypothetical protein
MDINWGHWVFAGVFALLFTIGIAFAYREDIRKSPNVFRGSWKFLFGVVLLIMLLIVIKILSRFS